MAIGYRGVGIPYSEFATQDATGNTDYSGTAGQPWQHVVGDYGPTPPAPAPAPAPAPVDAGPPPADAGAPYYATDPNYQSALAQQQMGNSQADAALRAEQQRAIINFGDPALADMAGFGLDPQSAAFAKQNYLSGNATLARLDKAHQLARQAVINRLASHGILNSGDLGYLEGQENQSYGNQVYDARRSVLDALASMYQNYLTQRQGFSQNTLKALQPDYAKLLASFAS